MSSVKPDLHAQGTRLLVDLPKDQLPKEQAQREGQHLASSSQVHQDLPLNEEFNPRSGKSAEFPLEAAISPTNSAEKMTKVEVQKGDGEATVVLFGDGGFTYDAKRIGKDRLVIDLPHVSSAITSSVLSVNHSPLKQIRIGHHPKKVRLVLDLLNSAAYTITSGPGRLAIRLITADNPETTVSALPDRQLPATTTRMDSRPPTVRVAAPGNVPFPERLSMIQATPALAQMPAETKSQRIPRKSGNHAM